MKFFILFFLIAANQIIFPQNDDKLVKNFKVDFTVPDIPAFKISGNESSVLLKPSTPEAVSLIVSDFLDDKIQPGSFSAEIAPFILFKYNSMTLQDYDANQVLYSLRISVATTGEEDNTNSLSLGGRITLIDEGDLKNDLSYRDELFLLTDEALSLDSALRKKYLEENNLLIIDVISDSLKKQEMDNYIAENVSLYEEYLGLAFDERVHLIKEKYKAANWNKTKWDIAAATLGVADSLNKKIKFLNHALWSTYALPVSYWGQLLIGGNINLYSDDKIYLNYSLASRFYGGINKIKAFFEIQFGYNEIVSSNNLLLNFGSELNLFDGIWINFYAGAEYPDLKEGTSQFISHFDLRFTIPEEFNLF